MSLMHHSENHASNKHAIDLVNLVMLLSNEMIYSTVSMVILWLQASVPGSEVMGHCSYDEVVQYLYLKPHFTMSDAPLT